MSRLLLLSLALTACGPALVSEPDASLDAGESIDAGASPDAGDLDAGATDAGDLDAGGPDAGPADAGVLVVDRSNPQLYRFQFTAASADADAGRAMGNEVAALDTRVPSTGLLVVYLHGAGAPATCGSTAHGDFLAARGFHVIGPCYVSDYGVGNCGADIGGCRLEAFDGVDRTSVIDIKPPDSIEVRVVRMLQRLQALNSKGDWQFFIVDGKPRWDRIIISGISHGASTAGVIAKVRPVARAVMLSGPLDTNQAWLSQASLTPPDRQWGFTHSVDPQHPGHLSAFGVLQLPGAPQRIEAGARPWNGSHRLFTSIDAGNGDSSHSSTQAGGSSPRAPDGGYLFGGAWNELYGVP
ncbi:MAG: hypothetical protein Q8L48_42690 [Archangium sp.]|nr:hypothetical protein [Archangium sp.]